MDSLFETNNRLNALFSTGESGSQTLTTKGKPISPLTHGREVRLIKETRVDEIVSNWQRLLDKRRSEWLDLSWIGAYRSSVVLVL
jgi:hypothetical protein